MRKIKTGKFKRFLLTPITFVKRIYWRKKRLNKYLENFRSIEEIVSMRDQLRESSLQQQRNDNSMYEQTNLKVKVLNWILKDDESGIS
jgi:hypothetical protein